MNARPHRNTPLWPAGHLPHKGGDHRWPAPCPAQAFASASIKPSLLSLNLIEASHYAQLISPLVGEMAGRPEGGWHGKAPATGETPP
ncbi:assimilatory nitrate reductase catalytic subunit/cobaltochelatase CobN [Rhizobium cellulosilyticum]|jgi:assimilatory nitrate reductase catalytic subunit/cobaltochelatase CobN|uniref:Assimilatory nitrate reductase catalytic subunit/cobaltochelatase CobN n=1 Tax=Aliirhizobium cellulosilyticum TaxID=393664 RepID=A0A7W6UXN0_9HYPH|nr:assimilatory nitrate reductase catalytic subunit/cobaltochelatase CobN [Rhizobium cellulosilyticum]MBB4411556.1 assimilatory nitrate reductase catalytic subunit/cobaltochelatase CobN [Rhizobium cellulosilyticum]MBB4446247.1 assimilatory nitrate reductase catalytic subunit/cobaltochelatase CobN [Rhizobium cellulosilyticum]